MRFTSWAICFFCLVGLVSSEGLPTEENRQPIISIVGGTPASLGEFPALGAIRHSRGSLRCGATLIGPSHVLTAAHCLTGLSARDVMRLSLIFNTLTVAGGTDSVIGKATKAIIHPSYTRASSGFDIALMVLRSPITAISSFSQLPTESEAPATEEEGCSCKCMSETREVKPKVARAEDLSRAFSTYSNSPAVIAGWGSTSSGGSLSPVLLKANVTVLDNSVCTTQYNTLFSSTAMLCAAATGVDTCQGDSGGPIYVDGVQVGITSWGFGCADPRYAGVYARVSTYMSWIRSAMAANPA